MSRESAKKLLEKIQQDEDFKNKLSSMKTKEERIEFIKGEGFDFTEEEFHQARTELTPETLDEAAGGSGCGYTHESEKSCRTRTCKNECPGLYK